MLYRTNTPFQSKVTRRARIALLFIETSIIPTSWSIIPTHLSVQSTIFSSTGSLNLRRARDNYPKSKCMGTKITPKDGEPYYEWLTYEECDELAQNLGKLL